MPRTPIIAVVEDDAAMREALADLIQVVDLECRPFDRADAFLAAYGPDCCDCVITDVRMPGMNGLELQQRLRALGSTLPVIIITANADAALRLRALESGVFAYLTKPVGDEALIRAIRAALAASGFG